MTRRWRHRRFWGPGVACSVLIARDVIAHDQADAVFRLLLSLVLLVLKALAGAILQPGKTSLHSMGGRALRAALLFGGGRGR